MQPLLLLLLLLPLLLAIAVVAGVRRAVSGLQQRQLGAGVDPGWVLLQGRTSGHRCGAARGLG